MSPAHSPDATEAGGARRPTALASDPADTRWVNPQCCLGVRETAARSRGAGPIKRCIFHLVAGARPHFRWALWDVAGKPQVAPPACAPGARAVSIHREGDPRGAPAQRRLRIFHPRNPRAWREWA